MEFQTQTFPLSEIHNELFLVHGKIRFNFLVSRAYARDLLVRTLRPLAFLCEPCHTFNPVRTVANVPSNTSLCMTYTATCLIDIGMKGHDPYQKGGEPICATLPYTVSM